MIRPSLIRRSVTRRLAPVVVALVLIAAATPATATAPEAEKNVTITLVAHDSYNVSKSVLRTFTEETGIHVKVLRGGDAGSTLNQAILTKDHPLGDVLYGVDNAFLSRALKHGIFEPYESPELAFVPTGFQRRRRTPRHADRPLRCLHQLRQAVVRRARHSGPAEPGGPPRRPQYRDLLVAENPATSSTGLDLPARDGRRASKATRIRSAATGPGFARNGVKVVKGWEQAWYGEFTAGSEDGERPLVVSYASSPVATIDEDTGVARAGTVLDTCFQQDRVRRRPRGDGAP